MNRNDHKRTKTEPAQSTLQDRVISKYSNSYSIAEEEAEYILTDRNNNQKEFLQIESIFNENKPNQQLNQLTNQQMASLKECFEKFSTTKTIRKPPRSRLNANGIRQILPTQPQIDITLSQKQLNQLFIDASIPLHKQTLSQIYGALSKNNKGKGVCFKDLEQLLKAPNGIQESYSDYEQIFKVYDRFNRGYFDYEDYKFMCLGVSKQLGQAQIRQAFNAMDNQKLNRITFNQFVLIMRGIN